MTIISVDELKAIARNEAIVYLLETGEVQGVVRKMKDSSMFEAVHIQSDEPDDHLGMFVTPQFAITKLLAHLQEK